MTTPRLRATLTGISDAEVDVVVTSTRIKGLASHQEPIARRDTWIAYVSPTSWKPLYVVRAEAGHWVPSGATERFRTQWYRDGIAAAESLGAHSVGFATGPADPGVWPLDDWVRLALTALRGTPSRLNEIVFCCNSPGGLEAFAAGIIRTS
jgi:hypothetical protein